MKVKIVTDSACDLTDAVAHENDIAVVPLAIRFGETEYIDRAELSVEDFWSKLAESTELPSTAAPSSEAFETVFLQAKDAGYDAVVCINLSSKLSATYQAAVKGAEALGGGFEVRVIDSEQCTIAEGTMVLHAASLAKAGNSAEEIVQKVEDLRSRTRLYGTLDTVENLRRGGRVGKANALIASLLSVKPVITIRDGEVHPESRQRTRRRALEHLAKFSTENPTATNVTVAHSGAPDLTDFLAQISDQPATVPVSMIGPVIGTHGGPRLIAVSFVEGPLPS